MENEMFLSEKKKMAMLEKSKDFALYKSKRISIEHFRKVLKSKLMKEAMVAGVKSAQAQEREAYADDKYEALIDSLEFSSRMETELYWELKIFQMESDMWRTVQANKRNDI